MAGAQFKQNPREVVKPPPLLWQETNSWSIVSVGH
jgi:hypothetical protein